MEPRALYMLDKYSTTELHAQPWITYFLFCIFSLNQHVLLKYAVGCVLVAYTYNPSYSGGRDQRDRSLRPARPDSS
jgi:hypothetical protein